MAGGGENTFGTRDRGRTYDTQLRKLVLYPLSYARIAELYHPWPRERMGLAILLRK